MSAAVVAGRGYRYGIPVMGVLRHSDLLGGENLMADERASYAKVTGPLAPRRAIAVAIRRLREDKGKSLQDVAAELLISRSKLSRLENAQGRPLPRDIRDLIRYYEIEGTPLAHRLQRWVREAQKTGWWTDFEVLLSPSGVDAHLAYETDATVERIYTLPFLPALLQTREYAAAVFRDMEGRPPEEVDKLVEYRLRRQSALRSREGMAPLQLVAVTYESTLRHVVGSPEIMAAQLDALEELAAESNIRLHVLPFSAKPVFSMTCMYAYFEYRGADNFEQDLVHIETHAGFIVIDDPEKVADYCRWHDSLVEASLSERESREFIRDIKSGFT
jgi:transcriptional regulator with XRE-family HTH domain